MPTTKKQAVVKRKPIYEYSQSGRIVVGYVYPNGETTIKKPSDVKKENEEPPPKKKTGS